MACNIVYIDKYVIHNTQVCMYVYRNSVKNAGKTLFTYSTPVSLWLLSSLTCENRARARRGSSYTYIYNKIWEAHCDVTAFIMLRIVLLPFFQRERETASCTYNAADNLQIESTTKTKQITLRPRKRNHYIDRFERLSRIIPYSDARTNFRR